MSTLPNHLNLAFFVENKSFLYQHYYWHKNKRKFLSLWAVIQTLRKASFRADLILVNYSDNKVEGIKEMIVQSIKENTSKVFRASSTDNNGNIKKALLNHVDTIDQLLTYEQWKHNFKNFNDNKKGDTWEILDFINRDILITTPHGKYNNTPISKIEYEDLVILATNKTSSYKRESLNELIRRLDNE